MLASWIKRYAFGEGKIWKQIIDDKYDTHNPNIFSCNIEWSFPFLEKCYLVAAKAAKIGYSWKVGNGESIRFWEDKWCGQSSLATQFWDLYNIAIERDVTVGMGLI